MVVEHAFDAGLGALPDKISKTPAEGGTEKASTCTWVTAYRIHGGTLGIFCMRGDSGEA
jgi:hypothetical protein